MNCTHELPLDTRPPAVILGPCLVKPKTNSPPMKSRLNLKCRFAKLLLCISIVLPLPSTFSYAGDFTVSWDTTPSWVGSAGVEIFGDVAYAYPACGQSFTAPAGINAMQSFTFFLNDRMNPDPVRFTANLVGWDGVQPVGPIVFTSAPVTTSNNHGLGGQEAFQFSMPNVPVTPGQQYLAFLTSIGVSGTLVGSAFVGVVSSASGDVLPGGQTYLNGLATTVQGLYDQPWWFLQPSTDLAFRAQFAAVPEPSPAHLALFCLALLAACRKAKPNARRQPERS